LSSAMRPDPLFVRDHAPVRNRTAGAPQTAPSYLRRDHVREPHV